MFKRLRNRFLLLEAAALLFFIAALLSFIAVGTYVEFNNRTNDLLTTIINSPPPSMETKRPGGLPKPERQEKIEEIGKPPRPEKSPIPNFVVWLDNDRNIIRIEGRPTTDFVLFQAVATLALQKNEPRGMMAYEDSVYKFKSSGNQMAFADVTIQIATYKYMLAPLIWFSIPVLIFIFLISLFLANRAIKPIAEAFKKQKEFVADASHELKTPLTTINSTVDILLDSSDKEQKKWLGYIKTESGRMSTLITSMLYLAEIEHKNEIRLAKVDLSKLLEGTLLPLEAVFYEKKISMDTQIAEGISIQADETLIRRLIGILLDNAVKYSSGKVRVSLEKTYNRAELTVANSVDNFPQAELEKIWDRFYRVDKSREYTGGFGLGLAIAKLIVEQNKGEVSCALEQDSFIRFTVRLPLA